mmetsp:Transcript_23768/g.49853  ORF Transcript_23768/g.49853 Transcript_23768/m.49853 type:complete len:403 (-) Transcript_23768:270-1478(-)
MGARHRRRMDVGRRRPKRRVYTHLLYHHRHHRRRIHRRNIRPSHAHPPLRQIPPQTIPRPKLPPRRKYGGQDCPRIRQRCRRDSRCFRFQRRRRRSRQEQQPSRPNQLQFPKTTNRTPRRGTGPRSRRTHRRPPPIRRIVQPPMHRNRRPLRRIAVGETSLLEDSPRGRIAGRLRGFGEGGGRSAVDHREFAVLHHESDFVRVGGCESWEFGEECYGDDAVGGGAEDCGSYTLQGLRNTQRRIPTLHHPQNPLQNSPHRLLPPTQSGLRPPGPSLPRTHLPPTSSRGRIPRASPFGRHHRVSTTEENRQEWIEKIGVGGVWGGRGEGEGIFREECGGGGFAAGGEGGEGEGGGVCHGADIGGGMGVEEAGGVESRAVCGGYEVVVRESRGKGGELGVDEVGE